MNNIPDPESVLNMCGKFVSKCKHVNKFNKKLLIQYISSFFLKDFWDIYITVIANLKGIIFQWSDMLSDYARIYVGHFSFKLVNNFFYNRC